MEQATSTPYTLKVIVDKSDWRWLDLYFPRCASVRPVKNRAVSAKVLFGFSWSIVQSHSIIVASKDKLDIYKAKKSMSKFLTFLIRTASIDPLAARISCGLLNCCSPLWTESCVGGVPCLSCLSFVRGRTLRMECEAGDSR
jgi:hypothetical protein